MVKLMTLAVLTGLFLVFSGYSPTRAQSCLPGLSQVISMSRYDPVAGKTVTVHVPAEPGDPNPAPVLAFDPGETVTLEASVVSTGYEGPFTLAFGFYTSTLPNVGGYKLASQFIKANNSIRLASSWQIPCNWDSASMFCGQSFGDFTAVLRPITGPPPCSLLEIPVTINCLSGCPGR